ncbi:MAG: ribokinase [Actinomycetota bacterium]
MPEGPGAGAGPPSVTVVGSANVDLSIPVEVLPAPGETVLGGDTRRGPGGKGANQAVAAARLGARSAFVGRVGDDEGGRWLRDHLAADGVDVRAVLTTSEVPTGLAVITVDAGGENSIVVSSGANAKVTVADVESAAQVVADADVVLTQLETAPVVAAAVARIANGTTILNPAPARADVALDGFDVVVPNRGELAALSGSEETVELAEVADQARSLDVATVVVTLGAQGAMVVFNERPADGADVVTLPALPVTAVDTTAAGDSFCAALAVASAEGAGVIDAVGWAVRVAGRTVMAPGAQESLPGRAVVGHWRPDDTEL